MDSRPFTTPSKARKDYAKPTSQRIDQRVSVCFKPSEVKQIKRLAKKDERSVSGFIRNAVKTHMKLISH